MKAGDMIQVTITGISHQGYGIGRCDNIVVFVPGAMLGETVEALVVEYKKEDGHCPIAAVDCAITGAH